MSRRMKEKEEKFSSGASIERASDCLRHIFGKIKWRRKVATLLVAAMLTGTMSDGLAAVGVAGNGNVYASSSNARVEDDSGGGSSQKGKHAADYYLEDADALELEIQEEVIQAAMEAGEGQEFDLGLIPYDDARTIVSVYDEISENTEDYLLLDQGQLEDDNGKVSYFIYGRKNAKSTQLLDNLKVFVINGNSAADEIPMDYNIYLLVNGETIRLTDGDVVVKNMRSLDRMQQKSPDSADETVPSAGNSGSQGGAGGNSGAAGNDNAAEETKAPEDSAEDSLTGDETDAADPSISDTEDETEGSVETSESAPEDTAENPSEGSSEADEDPAEDAAEDSSDAADDGDEGSSEAAKDGDEDSSETDAAENETEANPDDGDANDDADAAAEEETDAAEDASETAGDTADEGSDKADHSSEEDQESEEDSAKAEKDSSDPAADTSNDSGTSKDSSDGAEDSQNGDSDSADDVQLSRSIHWLNRVTATRSEASRAEDLVKEQIEELRRQMKEADEEPYALDVIADFSFNEEELAEINQTETEESEPVGALARARSFLSGIGTQEIHSSMPLPTNSIAVLTADILTDTPKDMGERLYGENGTESPLTAGFYYTDAATVLPGNSVNITFTAQVDSIPNFNYSGTAMSLFDAYEDTVLYFKLPQEFSLNDNNDSRITLVSTTPDEDGKLTYQIVLGDVSDSLYQEFTVSYMLTGNGETPSGTTYTFGGEDVWMEATINIIDRSNGNKIVGTYYPENHASQASATITTTTNDVWQISKTTLNSGGNAESGYAQIDSENETVIFRYAVEVGLADSSGKISSDPALYRQSGRVPFQWAEITDTLTLTGLGGVEINETPAVKVVRESDQAVIYEGNAASFTLDEGDFAVSTIGSAEVPYYTRFLVTVTYPLEKFQVDILDDEYLASDVFKVNNEASLTYQLKGGNETEPSTSETDVIVQDVLTPGAVTVSKEITTQEGSTTRNLQYTSNATDAALYPGYVEFEIYDASTNEKVSGMKRQGSGANVTYTEAGRLTINPNADDADVFSDATPLEGTNNSLTVYLPVGDYYIKEVTGPENTTIDDDENKYEFTVTANGTAQVTITNESTISGISFKKQVQKDGSAATDYTGGKAGFSLYFTETDAQNGTDPVMIDGKTVFYSNSQGIVDIYPVDAGNSDSGTTYYVKEVVAPDGYIPDSTIYQADVEAGQIVGLKKADGTAVDAVINRYNTATLQVNKYLVTYNTDGKEISDKVPANMRTSFSFQIQRRLMGAAEWNAYGPAQTTLNESNGKTFFTVSVPIADESGTPYEYRVLEKLPADGGYYIQSGTETITDTSDYHVVGTFNTSEWEPGEKNQTAEAEVKNYRYGHIAVKKIAVSVSANGTQEQKTPEGVKFQLYRKSGETFVPVQDSDGNAITVTSVANGFASVAEGLPIVDEDGLISYYWKEIQDGNAYSEANGYKVLSADTETSVEISGGESFIGPYTLNSTGTVESTVYNVEQKVPYWIKKVVAGSSTLITADTATFTVVPVVNGEEDRSHVITVTTENGVAYIKLEPGTTYRVYEKDAPDHYIGMTGYKEFTTPPAWTPGSTWPVNTTAGYFTSVENEPLVSVTLTKKLYSSDGKQQSPLRGAEFTVYVKNSNEEFVPVNDGYSDKTFTTGTNGTATVYLKAGESYYFKETNVDDLGVIDPADIVSYYAGYSGIMKVEAGGYFGPVTISNGTGSTGTALGSLWSLQTPDPIMNFQYGSLQVTKYSALNETTPVSGVTFTLYSDAGCETSVVDSNGDPVTAVSGTNGQAVFSNLPVFDENGNRIRYYVKETAINNSGYQMTDDHVFSTYLKPAAVTSKELGDDGKEVANGSSSAFYNEPYFTLTATKYSKDAWDSQFNEVMTPQEGVTFALFTVDPVDSNQLIFVDTAESDANGVITFSELNRTKNYYLFEVENADNLLPENGTDELPAEFAVEGATLSKAEMVNYYHLEYTEAANATSKDLGNFINTNEWLQFTMHKTCGGNCIDAGYDTEEAHDVDRARFVLYAQDATGNISAPELKGEESYELSDPQDYDTYSFIGIYETGAKLNPSGTDRVHGEFDTTILRPESEQVYWLIEYKAAEGYELNSTPIALVPNAEDYSYLEAQGVIVVEYSKGQPTEIDFDNKHRTGEGSIFIGYVWMDKWLKAAGDPNSTATKLGGAKYGLYLAYEQDGTWYIADENPIDILETGLDTGVNADGTLIVSGQATSMSINMEDLAEAYPDYYHAGTVESGDPTDCIFSYTGSDGKEVMTATFVLQEISVPDNVLRNSRLWPLTLEVTADEVAENQQYLWISEDADHAGKTQIVNERTNNLSVTLAVYGYMPDDSTIEKTDSELQAGSLVSHEDPISGAVLAIERWNGTSFEPYMNGSAQLTVTTNANGLADIPEGLPAGTYRAKINSGVPGGYQNIYDTGDYARYFTVSQNGETVELYIPENPVIRLRKGQYGSAAWVNGWTFSSENRSWTTDSGNEGYGTLTVPSGTYTITENASADSGYSDEYFGKAGDTGITVGYNRSTASAAFGDTGKHEVILTWKDQSGNAYTDANTNMQVDKTYWNPSAGTLTIQKKDASNNELVDAPAEFQIWYAPFESGNADLTVNGETGKLSYVLTDIPDFSGTANYTEETENGEITLENLDPGWYKITETAAPAGYSLAEPDSANTKYVVISGGMTVTKPDTQMTRAAGTVDWDQIAIDPSDNQGGFQVSFENDLLVPIHLQKTLTAAAGTDLTAGDVYGKISFRLWKAVPGSDGSTTYTEVTSHSVPSEDEGSYGFETVEGNIRLNSEGTATIYVDNLRTGERYYVEEITDASIQSDWSITVPEGAITAEIDGAAHTLIPVSPAASAAPAAGNTTVIENVHQYATLRIKKTGLNGAALEGVTFSVYGSYNPEAEDPDQVLTDLVATTVYDEEDESYLAVIPVKESKEIFYVKETAAPSDYSILDTVWEVTLSPGAAVSYETDGTWEIANQKGLILIVTDYADVYENHPEDQGDSFLMNGQTIGLYYRLAKGDGTYSDWMLYTDAQVTADGKVTFNNVTAPGDSFNVQYAIGPAANTGSYAHYTFESAYTEDAEGTPVNLAAEEGTADGAAAVLVPITMTMTAGETYYFSLYNEHPISLEIRKTAYPELSQGGTVPTARFQIFTVNEDGEPAEAVTFGSDYTAAEGGTYTSVDTAVVTGETYSSRIIRLPAGSYYVQEEKSLTDGYRIVKDEPNVIWERYITVDKNGSITDDQTGEELPVSEDTPYLVFTNMKVNMTIGLSKTLSGAENAAGEETTALDSLLTAESQKVAFTLTPTVTNTLPLKSLTVEDYGLTMLDASQTALPDDVYADGKYAITSVVLNPPENMAEGVSAEIRYTHVDSDGTQKTDTITRSLQAGTETTAEIPEALKAQSITVTYRMSGGQILPAGFDPGTIQVTASVYAQETGSQIKPVRYVRNTAQAYMEYTDWQQDGTSTNGRVNSGEKQAQIPVNELNGPVLSIEKQAWKDGEPLAESTVVKNGDELHYRITVTNESPAESGLDISDLVVFDRMPDEVDGPKAVNILDDEESGLTIGTLSWLNEGSNYLMIPLNGTLAAGESAVLDIQVTVNRDIIYISSFTNTVYLTTAATGSAYEGNEDGSLFKTTVGNNWADRTTDPELSQNEQWGSHTFISAVTSVTADKGSSMNLAKAVAGTVDPGEDPEDFVSGEEAARVARGTTAKYRLTAYNGSATRYTDIEIGDLLPYRGDNRQSQWGPELTNLLEDGNLTVTQDGRPVASDQYTIYTYTGTSDADAEEAYTRAIDTDNAYGATGFTQASDSTNWSDVRAFILVFADDFTMASGDTLEVIYRVSIPDFADDVYQQYVYQPSVNTFQIQYKAIAADRVSLPSNIAQMNMEPSYTQVGGRIWLDANNNGIQDDQVSFDSELLSLIQSAQVTLYSYEGSSETAVSSLASPDEDGAFIFTGLRPAEEGNSGRQLYVNDELQVSALQVPEYAATYRIAVTISGADSYGLQLSSRYQMESSGQITDNHAPNRSREPSTLQSSGTYAYEAADSNFDGTAADSATERFYLFQPSVAASELNEHPEEWDNTKDLGITRFRNLVIQKRNAEGEPIEGAEFTIYGPFDSVDEYNAAVSLVNEEGWDALSEDYASAVKTTDSTGNAVFENLLYYQYYLLAESKTVNGYSPENASAETVSRDEKWGGEAAMVGPESEQLPVWQVGYGQTDGTDHKTETAVIRNSFEKGSLSLQKTDAETGDTLSGARFTLTAEKPADVSVDVFRQAAAEITAGFANGTWPGEAAEGIEVKAAAYDTATGKLTITFTLTDGAGVFDGILPYGSYTLTEIRTPDGYQFDSDSPYDLRNGFTFDIGDTGDGQTEWDLTNTGGKKSALTNAPQIFLIKKTAEENGSGLAGVTFRIFEGGLTAEELGDEKPVKTVTTSKAANEVDAYAAIPMTGLKKDTVYTVTEAAAPTGYEELEAPFYFMLVDDEEEGSETLLQLQLTDISGSSLTSSNDGKVTLIKESDEMVIQAENTRETGSLTLSKALIGDVTDPITGYGDTFKFTLKLEQPLGYTNPVLASMHETGTDGKVAKVNAVKTVPDGNGGSSTENLQFDIMPDGTISGIELKKDESLTIEGIYYGTAYTVTEDETVKTGFAFAGSVVQTGDSSQTGSENPVKGTTEVGQDTAITIQNQVKKASVKLAKTFDSDIPETLPTFWIYDITGREPYETAAEAEADPNAIVVEGSQFTIKWNGDEEKPVYEGTSPEVLIPGRTYQIVEVLDPNDEISAGYTAKVSGAIPVTVGNDNILVVDPQTMENNRTKGWIQVSKALRTFDEETIAEERTFYYSIFKVKDGAESPIDLGEYKLDADHPTIGVITNQDAAHSHFVDFGTYRIAEVDKDGNEIQTGSSSLDYNVSNPGEIELKLDNENHNTVSGTIINTENPLGSITVVKKADYVKAGTEFHFLVRDANKGFYIDMDGKRQQNKADAIWTIEAGSDIPYTEDMVEVGRKTAVNVPYGTYTVTEVDADGNALTETYAYTPSYTVSVGNGAETAGNSETIEFAVRSMTVTVSNEIGRAGMEIVKTFDDTSAIPEDTNLPSFTIYRIEDVGDPITSADDVAGREAVGEIQIVRQADGTFKGELANAVLIPGYYYQAVENLADDEISKLYDPLVSDVIMAAVNDDGTQIPVVSFGKALENQRQRGYLRISKNLENAYGEQTGTGRTFYYVVQDENGNAITLPETYQADASRPTVGMISANDEVHTILVEFGTYSVYETDAEGNVYDADYPNPDYEVKNPEPVAIKIGNADPSDEGTLAVIRNKERDLGKLTIVKQADYADAGSSFYFLVEDERGQYLTSDGTLLDEDTASPSQAKWTITAEEDVTYISDEENEGHGKLSVIGYEEAENIPYGTYTVTEVDAEGNPLGESFAYEVSSRTAVEDSQGQITETEGGTGEITIYQRSMTVTVTNLVKKTRLTIEKTFDSHVPSEENLPKFAVYQLADPNRPITSPDEIGEGDVQVATVSIASRSNGTYGGETQDILIPGYSYQAVEILGDDEISRLYDPLTGENHVMTVTLEEDGMAVNALAYTAENIRSYGYLTVTKELFDYYGESLDDVRTFYYRIRNTETGEYVTIEPEYRPENAQDLTQVAEITTAAGDENVHFVKYGTYEIVETDENGNVYNDSESLISGFVNGLLGRETNPTYIVENPEPVEIILDNADTASASIANRERALGELTIVKETDWAESGQTEFYFTVQNEKGELLDAPAQGLAAIASLFKSQDARKIWTITADRTTDTMAEVGRLTIGELPYGIYTVTEVDQNGNALSDEYPYTVSYQVEVSGKDAVSSADKGQGELDYQHPSMTVTVTNTRNKGYLAVRKNLQDYQGNTLTGTGRQFYFTVLDEDGNAVELPEEFRYEGQQYVGWITDNTSRELFLPYGTYRVLETDEEGQPYDAQNENLLYEVTTPGAVELSLANADSAEAVIVNKEKTIGSLTVTKRVNRTANGTTFYFIVTNSKGERMPMPDENGNPTEETIWRISASQNVMTDTAIGSLTLKNLPYDTYTVTEVRENGEALADSYIYNVSYETTAQGVTASGQSGTITIDARDMDVTVTNTRKTGGGSGDGDGGGGGGSDGGGGGSTITVTTDVPTASITDPGIPLSPYPGDGSVIIPEGEVPLFGLPKTGDNSISAAGLAGIMLAALLSACGIIRKRKKEEES